MLLFIRSIYQVYLTWQNTNGNGSLIEWYKIMWESGQSAVNSSNNNFAYNYTLSGLSEPGNLYNVSVRLEFNMLTSVNTTTNNYTNPVQPQSLKVTEQYTNILKLTCNLTRSWLVFYICVNTTTESANTTRAYVDNNIDSQK